MEKSSCLSVKIAVLVVLCAMICALCFVVPITSSSITLAQDSTDNFSMVFPNNSYFQSSTPTLIGANKDYLIIYDKTSSKIYARSNSEEGSWVYDVAFQNVSNIFAIGTKAFLHADGNFYTIDLTDKSATVTQIELASPNDISFFNSDGTYLYAKSTAGYITVYDQNFDIAFSCDNHYNDDLLAGKSVVAGEMNTLYVFTIVYGNPFFVRYDLTSGAQDNPVGLTKYVQQAYVGDVIYALDTDNRIVCIDKQNGELIFTSDIIPDNFFAFGSSLFSIEGRKIVIYSLSQDRLSLRKTATISMAGDDLSHLDAPTDVCKTQNGFAVADSNNNRVAHLDNSNVMTATMLDFSPKVICANTNDVFVANQSTLLRLTDKEISATYQLDGIVDITYLDKLYILTTDGVYTTLGKDTLKLCDIVGGQRITCAEDGNNVYVLKDGEIATISRTGQMLPPIFVGDTTGVIDFCIDYVGKVTLVYENGYKQYFKSTLCGELTLQSSTLNATMTGACLVGKKLYFTTNECFVGVCDIESTQKNEYVFTTPSFSDFDYHFAKSDSEITYIPQDGRIEAISTMSPTTLLVIDGKNDDGLNFAVANGILILVDETALEQVEYAQLSGELIATTQTTLYTIPYVDNANSRVVEANTRLVALHDCADFDGGKWIVVSYEGKEYFVKQADTAQYIEEVPEIKKVYGKANADRVGGLVNVYTTQALDQDVLTQIVDGTKVEVLETFDNCYLVSVDGYVGYMSKDEVVLDGLTTVQIIAIVLSIVVVVTGSAIFASIHLTRKSHDDKQKNTRQ